MNAFMQIDCKEIMDIMNQKMIESEIKQEGNIRYYNFCVMNLIEKINAEEYADFGFSKVLASYFDIPINTEVSKVTLDDFNKVNQTLGKMEKTLNELVKANGALYMTRNEDNFSIMYYEVLN